MIGSALVSCPPQGQLVMIREVQSHSEDIAARIYPYYTGNMSRVRGQVSESLWLWMEICRYKKTLAKFSWSNISLYINIYIYKDIYMIFTFSTRSNVYSIYVVSHNYSVWTTVSFISNHHDNREEKQFNQVELLIPIFDPINEPRSFSSTQLNMQLTFSERSMKMISGYVGVFHANILPQQLLQMITSSASRHT